MTLRHPLLICFDSTEVIAERKSLWDIKILSKMKKNLQVTENNIEYKQLTIEGKVSRHNGKSISQSIEIK